MDDNEITQRLRDAGDQPIPGEVRATHLSQMHAAVPVAEKPKRFGRFAVAAAAFVGFAVGSTGFAMAGALPAPAQQVAHDVLSVVQVNVPDGEYKNHGECVSEAMRDVDPAASEEARKAAKDAACPKAKGKPEGVGNGKPAHAGKPGGPNGPPHEGDDCKGPPPWAGKGAKDADVATKEAFKAERAACQPEAGDDPGAEALEKQQEKDAEALEEQREAEGEQQVPPAPAEQAPADPGAAGNAPPADDPAAQGTGDAPVDLPGPIEAGGDPDAEAKVDAQDTDPAGG